MLSGLSLQFSLEIAGSVEASNFEVSAVPLPRAKFKPRSKISSSVLEKLRQDKFRVQFDFFFFFQ